MRANLSSSLECGGCETHRINGLWRSKSYSAAFPDSETGVQKLPESDSETPEGRIQKLP